MLIPFFAKMLHHRCSTGFYIRLCSQLYFPSEKELNEKINSLRTFYTLTNSKKFSDSQKKVELGCMTPKSGNGSASLELIWLVCFKLIWSCKHRIWDYHFWFRKSVKLIWSNKFDRVLACKISLYYIETKEIKLFYLHCSCETLLSNEVRRIWEWSKIICQINQEIIKASKNNRSSSKTFQLICP